MERLTKYLSFDNNALDIGACRRRCRDNYRNNCTPDCLVRQVFHKLAKYEDTGLLPEEIVDKIMKAEAAIVLNEKYINNLKKYQDAEENGLLLRLPCKVGDKVYVIRENAVTKMQVTAVEPTGWIAKNRLCNAYLEDDYTYFCATFRDFGKIVFSSHDEAEKALSNIPLGDAKGASNDIK